jgi:hypothetical protein
MAKLTNELSIPLKFAPRTPAVLQKRTPLVTRRTLQLSGTAEPTATGIRR